MSRTGSKSLFVLHLSEQNKQGNAHRLLAVENLLTDKGLLGVSETFQPFLPCPHHLAQPLIRHLLQIEVRSYTAIWRERGKR